DEKSGLVCRTRHAGRHLSRGDPVTHGRNVAFQGRRLSSGHRDPSGDPSHRRGGYGDGPRKGGLATGSFSWSVRRGRTHFDSEDDLGRLARAQRSHALRHRRTAKTLGRRRLHLIESPAWKTTIVY